MYEDATAAESAQTQHNGSQPEPPGAGETTTDSHAEGKETVIDADFEVKE